MADINFDCPLCGQNLDSPEDMVGLYIDCPSCSGRIQIPKAKPAVQYPIKTTAKPSLRPEPGTGLQKPAAGVVPATAEEKGSTTRIELPPDAVLPKQSRIIVIKRPDK